MSSPSGAEEGDDAILRTLKTRSSAQNFDDAFASLKSPAQVGAAEFKAAKAAAIGSAPAAISLDVTEGSLKEYDEQGHLKWLEQFGVGGEEGSNAVVSGVGQERGGESRASTSTTTVVTSTSWWSTVPVGLTVDHPHRGLGTVTRVNEGGSARVIVQYAIGGKPQTCDETVWRALLRESKAIRARSARRTPKPLRGDGGGGSSASTSSTTTTTTRTSSTHSGESAADAVRRRMGADTTERRSVELSALTHRSPPRSARSTAHSAYTTAEAQLGMSHTRWEAKRDGATSKKYYVHAATGEVRWSEPEDWSPFYNTLALGYSVPAPPVPSSGPLVLRTRGGAGSTEEAKIMRCADDPRCGGGNGQRCCSSGSGPESSGGSGGDGDGGFGRTDAEENDGSCGAPKTVPHPDGHCVRCGCLLVGRCHRSLGIAWSCVVLVLGAIVLVRACYLLGTGIAIIVLYSERTGRGTLKLAIDDRCFDPWGFCDGPSSSWKALDRRTCRKDGVDTPDDDSFCWRRCCTNDDQWLLPMVYLQGNQIDRANLYFSNFRSALWLFVFGALLVVFSLAHPKVACSKRKAGRTCRNAMWVMDGLTRIGGLGVLLVFVACSPGGGNLHAMRAWFSFFLAIGLLMMLLAVVDSLFHFLPQPLPLIAACGCCGCSASTRVGGSDLEENEGSTDYVDDSKACTLCWCGSCAFKGGSLWTLVNIVVALLSVPQSVLLTPVWAWTYEAALAMAVTTAALLVATSIIFVSLVTPKRMWRPLWFFDPLRSLFGLGCAYLYLGADGNLNGVLIISEFMANRNFDGNRIAGFLFANFYTTLGCVMILCALFNMHCKSCCTCTCAECDGVPEPYPLLAYACDAKPLCKFKAKTCRGLPPPQRGDREDSWDDEEVDARI